MEGLTLVLYSQDHFVTPLLDMSAPTSSLWLSPLLGCPHPQAISLRQHCFLAWSLPSQSDSADGSGGDGSEDDNGSWVDSGSNRHSSLQSTLLLPLSSTVDGEASTFSTSPSLEMREQMLLQTYQQRHLAERHTCVFKWAERALVISPTNVCAYIPPPLPPPAHPHHLTVVLIVPFPVLTLHHCTPLSTGMEHNIVLPFNTRAVFSCCVLYCAAAA